MPPTPGERAGHAIRIKAHAVAEAAVAALYRLRPDLEQRYGEGGRRHCARDLAHHLRFLAAAVELDDPNVFGSYAAWAVRVMAAHNVAAEDALASFRCLLEAAPDAAPPEAAAAVRDAITAALRRIEAAPPPRVSPRPRTSGAAAPTAPAAPPSPSTAGSTPSRS